MATDQTMRTETAELDEVFNVLSMQFSEQLRHEVRRMAREAMDRGLGDREVHELLAGVLELQGEDWRLSEVRALR